MPQSISAPLPHAHAEPSAREQTRADKQAWRAQPVEARVSALEARWEETVPTLATIADLRGVENRLLKWGGSAAVGLLLALAGIVTSTHSRFDQVHMRIDSAVAELRSETRNSIAELRTETRDSIAELRAEIRESREETRASIAELRAEIRETNARIDARFDALMSELRSQRNEAR